jgi:hypothetical protein
VFIGELAEGNSRRESLLSISSGHDIGLQGIHVFKQSPKEGAPAGANHGSKCPVKFKLAGDIRLLKSWLLDLAATAILQTSWSPLGEKDSGKAEHFALSLPALAPCFSRTTGSSVALHLTLHQLPAVEAKNESGAEAVKKLRCAKFSPHIGSLCV